MGSESYNHLQLMGKLINLLGAGSGGGSGTRRAAVVTRSDVFRLSVNAALKQRLVIGLISYSNHLTSPQRRSGTLITESL